MEIINIVVVSTIIGLCFAPIIAFRMKRGLNPLGDVDNTISELSYKYFLYFQLIIAFTIWPSLSILFYGIALFNEHNFIKSCFCIVFSLIMMSSCIFLLKKLKCKYVGSPQEFRDKQ